MTTLATLSPKYANLALPALVREYAVFGDSALPEILDAYELTQEDFQILRETPQFVSLHGDMTNEITSKGIVQVKAKSYLELHLQTLHEMIAEKSYEASDRIKALELLAKIADALPKNTAPANTGMMVNFDFGSLATPATTIEAQPV
jgi:hypothetical protein